MAVLAMADTVCPHYLMKLSLQLIPLALVLSSALNAETPKFPGTPKVSSMAPFGWHRGGTVDVEFTGSKLFDPRGVLCADTDLIKVIKISHVQADPKVPDSAGKKAIASLQIDPNCPSGVHFLRLYTNYGVAEVMPFFVGALTTHVEAEPVEKAKSNNTQETAESLPGAATINGWILGDDADFFKYDVKKGQIISAEVECSRLALETEDGTEVIVTLFDAAGKTLATCDDTPLLLADPFVSIVAPADGPVFVSIKPLLPAASGKRIPYRLHVGDFRRPAGIYPAGGKPGEKLTVRLLGLPAGVKDKAEISLPQGTEPFRFQIDASTPTPNRLHLLSGPNVLETEPNESASQATTSPEASAPLALNGILEKDGDIDCFKFSAKKGQRLIIDGYAQALGSPADLQLEILPANAKAGQNPERADDSTDGDLNNFEQTYSRERLDPSLIFTAKEDGDYVLTVKDSRNLGNPLSVYRIEITSAQAGALMGFYSPDNNQKNSRISSQVARGNRALFLMNLRPTYGTEKITGELQVTARNLPQGVTLTAAPFTIDQKRIPIMLEAAADAPVTAAWLDLTVQPVDAQAPKLNSFFSHNIALTYANGDISNAAHFDKLAFAVTDEIPFSIKATQPTIALSRSGELLLEVELTRQPGFTDPVEIGVENVPVGIVPQTGTVITGDTTKATLRLAAEGGAQFGKFPIVVTARNRNTGDERAGRLRASSNQIELQVSEPFLRVKLARSSIERGKRTLVKATIESLHALPGAATMKLIRLPKGLEMAGGPIAVNNESKELTMELTASVDALVGTYPSIACEVAVTADGRELKQVAGTGLVRVDPARK
jgi:hypothetical protein